MIRCKGGSLRFDPIGMASVDLQSPQTLNLYAYCTNDPINHLDPSGLGFFSFLKKVFSFFSKVAKWVAIVVAVAVLVAAALTLVTAIPATEILGTVLFKLGILKLGEGVSAALLFSAESAGLSAGISLTSSFLNGVAAAGAVGEFLQKAPRSKGPDPRRVKKDFYERYGAILNNCIKQVFGKDARRIPVQTIKNSPILDSTLTGRQIGNLGPGGSPSGSNSPFKGKYGTVYLRKEFYLSKLPYTMEWIYGVYAHELGNILDSRLHPNDNVLGMNYGNKNDPFDLDTGAALERCMFGTIGFPDGTVR